MFWLIRSHVHLLWRTWWLFLIKLLVIPVWYIFSVIISRSYGIDTLGDYWLSIKIILFLGMIWWAGIGQALVSLVAQISSRQRTLTSLFVGSQFISLIWWVLVGWFLFFCSEYIAIHLFQQQSLMPFLQAWSFIFPLYLLQRHAGMFLKAIKHAVAYELVEWLSKISKLILLVLFVSWLFESTYVDSLWAYGWWLVISYLLALTLFTVSHKNDHLSLVHIKQTIQSTVRFSYPYMFIESLHYLITSADILIIGVVLSSTDVWIYQIILLFMSWFFFVKNGVQQVFQPELSHAFWEWRDRQSLQRIISVQSLLILIWSSLLLLFLLTIWPLLVSFYSVNISDTFSSWITQQVIIWALCMFLIVNEWNAGMYFHLQWKTKILTMTYIIFLVITIIWSLIVIWPYGIMWVLLVSLGSLFLKGVTLRTIVARKFSVYFWVVWLAIQLCRYLFWSKSSS